MNRLKAWVGIAGRQLQALKLLVRRISEIKDEIEAKSTDVYIVSPVILTENQLSGLMLGCYLRIERPVPLPSKYEMPKLQDVKDSFYAEPKLKQQMYKALVGRYTVRRDQDKFINYAEDWSKEIGSPEAFKIFVDFSEAVMYSEYKKRSNQGVYL